MTGSRPPESDAAAAADTPARTGRPKRSRVRAIAVFAGIAAAILLAVLILGLIGGRIYLSSESGRNLITSVASGQKIGRFGYLGVEGVKGDLLDDFTIDRVTVTDSKGVWLEIRDLHVDWSYWALTNRRFHATTLTAGVVRVIRRPEVEPSQEPSSPAPLAIDVDSFSADVELMEGFSKEYGRWKLTGEAEIPRNGTKTVALDALSNSRDGDFLRLKAAFGGKMEDMRIDLRASEARGGPIAGALGYSPDQPFSATALVDGQIVDAVVRTGDFTPLIVKGRYGEDGARFGGFIDFSGSDLLQPFISRIGRKARFGLATVPDAGRDGYQGIAWRLSADNINSRARGTIKLADRSAPEGIRIEISTPSLSRILDRPIAQAAAWTGVFTGDTSVWKLDGNGALNATNLISYRADRIAGPLDVQARNGRYTVDADLSTTGGSTAGVVGALLGATPKVQIKATRSTDGAILLERVEAKGQALEITGTGGRNLGGALSFRGRAAITDLARLQPRAVGSLGGAFTAVASRPNAPWRLSLDARGQRLKTGLAELDRLLGTTPRLQLDGTFKDGNLEIDPARLTGDAARASARGLIQGDGRLRLALDWTAEGPFGVGPIEVGGTMTGDGALTGSLANPRADLRAHFDTVAAGPLNLTDADLVLSFRRGDDASDGRIAITAGSKYGPATASGNFFLGGDRIRLTDVDLNAGGLAARGAIALSNSVPSSADLTFTARPGAFLTTGTADGRIRLTEDTNQATDSAAIVNIRGRNVRLAGSDYVLRSLDLNGTGTLASLPFTLSADVGGTVPVQFNGSGTYSRQADAQTVVLRGGGRVRDIAFSTRNPAVVALSGDGRLIRLDVGVGGGVLMGELRQDSNAAILQADLTSVELGSLASDMRGRVTGRVSLRGSGNDLSGSANVTLEDVRSIDAPTGLAIDGTLNALLVDNSLSIKADVRDEGAVTALVDVTLPVVASAAPLRLAVERTRSMSGTVSIQGQIQPIWDLFLGGERSLAGQVNANATLGGSLNEPRLNGRLDLTEGTFRDTTTGIRLADMTLASRFDDTTALIQTFNASDGSGGKVSGDGRIGLRQGSGSSFELALDRFRIIDNDIARARATGPLTVTRASDGKIQLSGQMDINDARIEANLPGSNGIVRMDVVEVNRPGGDPVNEDPAQSRGVQIGLDIGLRSRGGDIVVVGRGLNVAMSVDARVTGSIARPVLTGSANVIRGDYEFAGKRFVFDDQGSVSLSTDPARIRLDLSAVREDPALTATIRVTGTAESPKIALTSTPSLPQDEILSQVLFGRSASQLSPFEAAQLASGVASLAGGGGFDVIGNLRELAGLDRLSFGGEASALTVAGGRYITDDVYLEIIGGGEGGAAVNVEWQVRRNLAISSKFGGQGDASLSIRWRRQSRVPGTTGTDRRPNR